MESHNDLCKARSPESTKVFKHNLPLLKANKKSKFLYEKLIDTYRVYYLRIYGNDIEVTYNGRCYVVDNTKKTQEEMAVEIEKMIPVSAYVLAHLSVYGSRPKVTYSDNCYLINGHLMSEVELTREAASLQERSLVLRQLISEYQSAYGHMGYSLPYIKLGENGIIIDGKCYSDQMVRDEICKIKTTRCVPTREYLPSAEVDNGRVSTPLDQYIHLCRDILGWVPAVKQENGLFVVAGERFGNDEFGRRIPRLKKKLSDLLNTHSITLLESVLISGTIELIAACLKNKEVVFVKPYFIAKALPRLKDDSSVLALFFDHYGFTANYESVLANYHFSFLSNDDVHQILFSKRQDLPSVVRVIELNHGKQIAQHGMDFRGYFYREVNLVLAVKVLIESFETNENALSACFEGIRDNPLSILQHDLMNGDEFAGLERVLMFYFEYCWKTIDKNRYGLPGGQWFHKIGNEFLVDAGFERFTVDGNPLSGYICRVVYNKSEKPYEFMLNRKGLPENRVIALLHVYILAAIADMGSGEFVAPQKRVSRRSSAMANVYRVSAGSGVIRRPRRLSHRVSQHAIVSEAAQVADRVKRRTRSFYVSWFLRRCNARSREAERKALIFAGIVELPEGFTFVSPHWRGGVGGGSNNTEREVVSTRMVESLSKTVSALLKGSSMV